jgi:DNA-binding GntR family transcriptional regulator
MARRIVVKSLREQVYDHLKAELKSGVLDTGAFLDLNRLAEELGVSRTPLRDALIQLEAEEFVTIAPRRGVAVRTLEAQDIKEIYQLMGSLEATAVLASAPLGRQDIARLRHLDRLALRAVDAGDREGYYLNNYAFHDFFLERLGNARVTALVHLKRQQLYDWNRKFEHIHATWEHSGLHEHEEIVGLLERGRAAEAAAYLRDVHWGFKVQEAFVRQVYFPERP